MEELPRSGRSIRVMVDWSSHPLWIFDPYSELADYNYDPASPELGLSADLARDLTAWQNEWDATRNYDDLPSSAFPSDEAERRFDERGWELARRVRQEVNDEWDVTYFGYLSHTDVEVT